MQNDSSEKSLAQVLYEASPNVGWTGAWENLQPEQTRWWEAYAELARQHIMQVEIDLAASSAPCP